MLNQLKKRFYNFIENDKMYPFLAAIAAGLPPMLHYYKSNYWQVNSIEQLAYFSLLYLCIPTFFIVVAYYILKKTKGFSRSVSIVLLCLNLIVFATLTLYSTIGIGKKRILLVCFLALVISYLFKKFYKKIITFELLLAFILFVDFMPSLFDHVFYSDSWMKIEDDIEHVEFKKKPNIYLIQPDGYANFSELKKENYNFDNTKFESFLSNNGFKLYQDFRSNYYTTLSSNTSLFSMKHHYYNNPKKYSNELAKSREIITGQNPVVSIFKKNGYKTFLMLHMPYLIMNRPNIAYDYCNISYDDLPYISKGLGMNKKIEKDLEQVIEDNTATSNFYFIEQIAPGHISTYKKYSKGIEKERLNYLTSLKNANNWLENIISIINKKDKNGIIIIAADHGGFVGMTNTGQSKTKQISATQVKSIFTAALAIKWPDNLAPVYDNTLKTSVNIFRVLFSYLSNDEKYLQHLESNESYIIIKKGDKFGSYMRMDDSGNVVYKRKE